jgi:hypothetical protein
MALSINLTLVVQMIHFFIAYYLINYLFLRPGYKVVAAHMHQIKQIKSRIIARQELIAHKQNYKKTRWELFKDFFYKQKPQMPSEYRVSVSTSSLIKRPVTELSVGELEKEARAIADLISKKVLV